VVKLTIIKNTIPKGIMNNKKEIGEKGVLAVKRGLEVMRSYTLPFVPVKTGRLKGSLSTMIGKNSIYNIETEKRNGEVHKVIGEFGTNVPYAKYVEFGTSRFSGRYYMTRGIQSCQTTLRAVILSTLKQ
jgi:hypothetical protein